VPVPSQPPPPDEEIAGKSSGGGIYLAGALLLAGAALLLVFWSRKSAPPATSQTTVVVSATPPPPPEAPVFAPPPPPKIDDEPDAGAAVQPVAKGTGGPVAAGLGPCGGTCTGQATGALQSALRGRAQSAQGCYNRALRTSEVSGSLTVSVQVGPSGQACSASLVNDSVHSNEISSCVLGRFRGQSFPPPSGGCVTVNIPIAFTIKQ
jgi:hypothetical protein